MGISYDLRAACYSLELCRSLSREIGKVLDYFFCDVISPFLFFLFMYFYDLKITVFAISITNLIFSSIVLFLFSFVTSFLGWPVFCLQSQ